MLFLFSDRKQIDRAYDDGSNNRYYYARAETVVHIYDQKEIQLVTKSNSRITDSPALW